MGVLFFFIRKSEILAVWGIFLYFYSMGFLLALVIVYQDLVILPRHEVQIVGLHLLHWVHILHTRYVICFCAIMCCYM